MSGDGNNHKHIIHRFADSKLAGEILSANIGNSRENKEGVLTGLHETIYTNFYFSATVSESGFLCPTHNIYNRHKS